MAKLKIGKAIITWREGFLPECNCWTSRIFPFSLVCCWHLRYISQRREVGDKNFLFKSEGGKLI